MPQLIKASKTKYTDKEIAALCTSYGHTYINGYTSNKESFNCICKCGRNWQPRLSNLRRGYGCNACSHDRQKFTTEQVSMELLSYNMVLLKDYTHSKIPLIYECSCGGIGKSTLDSIRQGKKCGHCTEMQWRDYFLNFGCEIINYISAHEVIYRCSCGEICTIQASGFRKSGKKCAKCRVPWNRNLNPPPYRKIFYSWRNLCLKRDEYVCQICGDDTNMHVHHIESYYIKPDLAEDITNGISLCYLCHKHIHSKYGYNIGRDNLLKELI